MCCFIHIEIRVLINQLTPRSGVILVKLTVAQLVKTFPAFLETQRFIIKCFKILHVVF
jgi:hypothetical protein